MSNLHNDIILENLFEKYLDEGLSEDEATEAAREEFENSGK